MLSTWVLVSASNNTEGCLHKYAQCAGDLATLNPFEIHLILLDSMLANWRPYIIYLTEEITKQVCNKFIVVQEKSFAHTSDSRIKSSLRLFMKVIAYSC